MALAASAAFIGLDRAAAHDWHGFYRWGHHGFYGYEHFSFYRYGYFSDYDSGSSHIRYLRHDHPSHVVAYPYISGRRRYFAYSTADADNKGCRGRPWALASIGGRIGLLKHCDHGY